MPRDDEHEAVNNRLTDEEIQGVFDTLGLLSQQQRATYIALSEQRTIKSAEVIYTTRLSNNSEPITVAR